MYEDTWRYIDFIYEALHTSESLELHAQDLTAATCSFVPEQPDNNGWQWDV